VHHELLKKAVESSDFRTGEGRKNKREELKKDLSSDRARQKPLNKMESRAERGRAPLLGKPTEGGAEARSLQEDMRPFDRAGNLEGRIKTQRTAVKNVTCQRVENPRSREVFQIMRVGKSIITNDVLQALLRSKGQGG